MPSLHRRLDIHTIGKAAVHELRHNCEFLQRAELLTRDREVARAFALCARIHADLLAELARAGLDDDTPSPAFAPLDTPDFGAIEAALAHNDLAAAGVLLRRHIARTIELLECLFADYPSMPVRRAIKLHFTRILRSQEIMRRLSLRRAA